MHKHRAGKKPAQVLRKFTEWSVASGLKDLTLSAKRKRQCNQWSKTDTERKDAGGSHASDHEPDHHDQANDRIDRNDLCIGAESALASQNAAGKMQQEERHQTHSKSNSEKLISVVDLFRKKWRKRNRRNDENRRESSTELERFVHKRTTSVALRAPVGNGSTDLLFHRKEEARTDDEDDRPKSGERCFCSTIKRVQCDDDKRVCSD